ncbi:hypothetical protein ACJ41O_001206 [Fusarium nematophilum]
MNSESNAERQFDVQPTLLDWDEPNDPEHPFNWPRKQRVVHIGLVSFLSLVVNLAATLFAPAAADVVVDFAITDTVVASLIVSIYLLGFALGPLVIAPLSELYGRLWIYHICNTCFLAFTIGCATSNGLGPFLACRFLAGCAGAAPITIGGGTIADLVPVEKRGKAMAAFGLGPLMGPVLGPIIGGFVAGDLGWRWTLWIISIVSGVCTITCFILMKETFAPILLAAKASRLRKETGDLNIIAKGTQHIDPWTLLMRATVRPTKIFLFSPAVLGLSFFNAMVFGLIFLLFTTFPSVFQLQYGFSAGVSGLSYLGLGIGMMSGIVVFSVMSDQIMKRQGENGGMKPENRLQLMIWTGPLIPAGFFWYGWSVEAQTHWIVPILGTALIGVGSLFIMVYVLSNSQRRQVLT